jgi:hypothetical protein
MEHDVRRLPSCSGDPVEDIPAAYDIVIGVPARTGSSTGGQRVGPCDEEVRP